uniref:Bestrophin homolog n=1 Tax=Grammatophora oceanica TaxID=210454 RepID=A0A7S1VRX8_9STRA|mmetsp:Transcript_5686/g.8006  ORF Transcript_5686/g.8006 Transcript_5686/m.8006 type:complete len:479 (+) Transcript_5686:113-1549(+)|eukprot:CAMPEP_0194043334 /NCGR_PEP_ID=MMETSP0009_2-20130614/14996_1 /TAXON_ID=210454 /ORGANISM="Grammatophora oceanica, Strain CCMP 410" /LENGTH=478 /DNA_ID=CAMNT_0038687519 /DNA_START=91 /DNA_END=1527 /DNA_ORIENTATION=+
MGREGGTKESNGSGESSLLTRMATVDTEASDAMGDVEQPKSQAPARPPISRRTSSMVIVRPRKCYARDDEMPTHPTPSFEEQQLQNNVNVDRLRFQRRPTDSTSATEMASIRLNLGLYGTYPLAKALLKHAAKRHAFLKQMGHKQIRSVKGTDGWFASILLWDARALDNVIWPWCVLMLNCIVCTTLVQYLGWDLNDSHLQSWDTTYSLVLKTSLAFLLVFRLNRVAVRYWETRTMWGTITLLTRGLVQSILIHLKAGPDRDQAIGWTASFAIATLHFIRGEATIPEPELAGFLPPHSIVKLQDAQHPPLYAAMQARFYLKRGMEYSFSPKDSSARAIHLNGMEEQLNGLIAQVSGMERIRSTPLPIVYVAHLRTFLLAYLFTLPYIWVEQWKWATIPLVAFTSVALLGIEGASSECEVPFRRDRANHLALDSYCMVILNNVQDLVVHAADMDMQLKQDGGDRMSSFCETLFEEDVER